MTALRVGIILRSPKGGFILDHHSRSLKNLKPTTDGRLRSLSLITVAILPVANAEANNWTASVNRSRAVDIKFLRKFRVSSQNETIKPPISIRLSMLMDLSEANIIVSSNQLQFKCSGL